MLDLASHYSRGQDFTDTPQQWNRPRYIPVDDPNLFPEIVCVPFIGKRKTKVAAAGLGTYKRYQASPAVLSEERIQSFCPSLEPHESAPLFTAILWNHMKVPLCLLSFSGTT